VTDLDNDYTRGVEDGLELALLKIEKAKNIDEAKREVKHLLSLVKERKYSYLISLLEEIR